MIAPNQPTVEAASLPLALQFLNNALFENCLTSLATEFDGRKSGSFFHFTLHGSAPGNARARIASRAQGNGLAKEELIMIEGVIHEILPDGRFGVTLENEHQIIAYTAGKMRRFRIRSVVGDRVHVEMTPYDLSKGRIVFRERTPGQGPGGSRKRGFRR